MHKVILIDTMGPHTHKDDAIRELSELKLLVKTYGSIDIAYILQHRTAPDKATFIGHGKALELVDLIKSKKITLVVINSVVNSSQLFRLTKLLWTANPNILVWDRIDLILNIFDKHATSSESKLQIEIARMQHMGPAMYGLGASFFSRQGGGIGGRGIGETNIELMRRHWKDQIKQKKKKLEMVLKKRITQLERRKQNNLYTVSIVGYTNAGKTTLFNSLTHKHKRTQDALFVTLDSYVGSVFLPNIQKKILISDTIGFIRNLPPALVEAFKSTLLESVHADIVLHLIDITDPKMHDKIEIVESILRSLGIAMDKQMYVFNKLDLLEKDHKKVIGNLTNSYSLFHPQFISVKEEFWMDRLLVAVEERLQALF